MDRIHETKARVIEEARDRNRERVSKLANDDAGARVKEQEKLKKNQRKTEEVQKNIGKLKMDQLKIQRKIEEEKKKLIETQQKIEIQRKIEAQQKNIDKTTLQESDYKMNLVNNFDVQGKFELKKEFKVEPTKFDVKVDAWKKQDIKFETRGPKTPKPPTPPATKKDELGKPENKQGS